MQRSGAIRREVQLLLGARPARQRMRQLRI
jgi:hypothetical protein